MALRICVLLAKSFCFGSLSIFILHLLGVLFGLHLIIVFVALLYCLSGSGLHPSLGHFWRLEFCEYVATCRWQQNQTDGRVAQTRKGYKTFGGINLA